MYKPPRMRWAALLATAFICGLGLFVAMDQGPPGLQSVSIGTSYIAASFGLAAIGAAAFVFAFAPSTAELLGRLRRKASSRALLNYILVSIHRTVSSLLGRRLVLMSQFVSWRRCDVKLA